MAVFNLLFCLILLIWTSRKTSICPELISISFLDHSYCIVNQRGAWSLGLFWKGKNDFNNCFACRQGPPFHKSGDLKKNYVSAIPSPLSKRLDTPLVCTVQKKEVNKVFEKENMFIKLNRFNCPCDLCPKN